jgi:hypothetical protein
MHGMSGSFWIVYGILNVLLATARWPHRRSGNTQPEVGFWFFALAVITASSRLRCTRRSRPRPPAPSRPRSSMPQFKYSLQAKR